MLTHHHSNIPYTKMANHTHVTIEPEPQRVKICVLGAQAVGKSSIVQQFVTNQFKEIYEPTDKRKCYYPSVIINEHLYEVKIVDCPMIPYFPVNSLYEWTDFRGYRLRNATAYVLVFDISNDESFHGQYIKNLRDQIIESKQTHDVPLLVVGNKHDLSEERNNNKREVANLVKKQWKCAYVECSAKFNWHVIMVFKELMKAIDHMDFGHKPASDRIQDAL